MARQLRKKSGTGIYHVMVRGINRQDIFEDEEDYLQMVSILRALSDRHDEQGLRLPPLSWFKVLRNQDAMKCLGLCSLWGQESDNCQD